MIEHDYEKKLQAKQKTKKNENYLHVKINFGMLIVKIVIDITFDILHV